MMIFMTNLQYGIIFDFNFCFAKIDFRKRNLPRSSEESARNGEKK